MLAAGFSPRMVLGAVLLAAGACATTAPHANKPTTSGVVQVVAAENFWGSLATQTRRLPRRSHQRHHQPGHRPARLRADRRGRPYGRRGAVLIVNGIGYDAWADKLAAAPVDGRVELKVGDLVGVAGRQPAPLVLPGRRAPGDRRITADYKKLDPADAGLLRRRQRPSRTPTSGSTSG